MNKSLKNHIVSSQDASELPIAMLPRTTRNYTDCIFYIEYKYSELITSKKHNKLQCKCWHHQHLMAGTKKDTDGGNRGSYFRGI